MLTPAEAEILFVPMVFFASHRSQKGDTVNFIEAPALFPWLPAGNGQAAKPKYNQNSIKNKKHRQEPTRYGVGRENRPGQDFVLLPLDGRWAGLDQGLGPFTDIRLLQLRARALALAAITVKENLAVRNMVALLQSGHRMGQRRPEPGRHFMLAVVARHAEVNPGHVVDRALGGQAVSQETIAAGGLQVAQGHLGRAVVQYKMVGGVPPATFLVDGFDRIVIVHLGCRVVNDNA